MTDQNFHEIQLSGKQLVFLFMCAVVLTVVVFLFGVSVGRQVRPAAAENTAAAASAETDAAVADPAPTQSAPNELSYAQALEGGGAEDPSAAAPPPVPEEPTPSAPEKTAEPKAPAVESTPPPPPPAAQAPSSGWVVQVGAFNAVDVAAKEVAKLQGKGYPAFVFSEPEGTPGPRYKVRVGPYSARAEADRMLKTLTSEGYKPLLRR